MGAWPGEEHVLTRRGTGTPVGADCPYNRCISVGSLLVDRVRGLGMATGGELDDDDGDPTTNVARRGGVRGELEFGVFRGGDDWLKIGKMKNVEITNLRNIQNCCLLVNEHRRNIVVRVDSHEISVLTIHVESRHPIPFESCSNLKK